MINTPVPARTHCRICHSGGLRPFLDLGYQPPANGLLREDELALPEPSFPLALAHCPACQLILTTHVVAPDLLFRNYFYFSSVSDAMSRHFAAYAADVADRFVPANGLVVELGSNDGILLRTLIGRDVRILGVDPARNVAEVARSRGVPTLAEYFGEDVARQIRREHGPASALIANNVFAHIDDLDGVMRGVSALLDDRGVLVIEAPYVVPFLEHLEFDTVYHEHLSYLGVHCLSSLFGRHGFEVVDVREQSVHGGSIRVFAQRKGVAAVLPSVARMLSVEREAGVGDPARLDAFARDVERIRADICSTVERFRKEGKRVVGYTAPAKGNVLLNYCKLGPAEIEYLADATPQKQGLYNPGMHIPIKSPEHFREDRPDVALLLAWNHKDEILRKEQAWRDAGGKFVIPVPSVQLV